MKKLVLLTLLFLSSHMVVAGDILKCKEPISPYDINFQQGDENFLRIEVNENGEGKLWLGKITGKEYLLPIVKPEKVNLYMDNGIFSMKWDDGFLSMVYMGGTTWGAVLTQENNSEYPHEIEFFCTEKDSSFFD